MFLRGTIVLGDTQNKGHGSAQPAQEERRRSVRYPFTATAEIIELQTKAQVTARSADLGRGGCFIDTISPFPVGTSVMVRLSSGDKKFEASAKVVYSQIGMGMGLAFTAATPEQFWTLEQWLAEIGGDKPPSPAFPKPDASFASPPRSGTEQNFVLNELIITLIRKRVLTEAEGKALLQKLLS